MGVSYNNIAVIRRKKCCCVSTGTFAVISLMIGGVAMREAPDSMFYIPSANGTNSSLTLDVAARDSRRVQVAVVLTTLVGLIQVSLRKFLPFQHYGAASNLRIGMFAATTSNHILSAPPPFVTVGPRPS